MRLPALLCRLCAAKAHPERAVYFGYGRCDNCNHSSIIVLALPSEEELLDPAPPE